MRTRSSATSIVRHLLLLGVVLWSGGCRERQASENGTHGVPPPARYVIPLEVEEANGYPNDPAVLGVPLRQDWTELVLVRRADTFTLRLRGPGQADGLVLEDVDLHPMIPRVPAFAHGNAALTRLGLMQREFNRNETRYNLPGGGELVLANNCLRQGFWEVALGEPKDGARVIRYHGWFMFPEAEYARLFEEVNGVGYGPYRELLHQDPTLDGLAVPLDALRRVDVESQPVALEARASEPALRLPEQTRKDKLLLAPELRTFGDFAAAARQPIRAARFSEPGRYTVGEPVQFDWRWLAQPRTLVARQVTLARTGTMVAELELRFANGYRLLVGLTDLASLPQRPLAFAPQSDMELRRVTFGLSTPDISLPAAQRSTEFRAPRTEYLLLLDAQGNHVDNHKAGLDQVYLWGDSQSLHGVLVGYERIALVAHYAASLAGLHP